METDWRQAFMDVAGTDTDAFSHLPDEGVRSVGAALALSRALAGSNYVSGRIAGTFPAQATQLQTILEQLRVTAPADLAGPIAHLDKVVHALATQYAALLAVESADQNRGFVALRAQAEDLLKAARTSQTELDQHLQRAKATTAHLGQVSAATAADALTKHFSKLAEQYAAAQGVWGKITVGAVTAALAVTIGSFLYGIDRKPDTAGVVMFGIAISVVISSALFCARTYRAQQHNHAVNTHRVAALSTFASLRDAAGEDEATRNSILLMLGDCVFKGQDTGFGGGVELTPPSAIVQAQQAIKASASKSIT